MCGRRGGQTRDGEIFIFLVMHYDLVLGREEKRAEGHLIIYIYIYVTYISNSRKGM